MKFNEVNLWFYVENEGNCKLGRWTFMEEGMGMVRPLERMLKKMKLVDASLSPSAIYTPLRN